MLAVQKWIEKHPDWFARTRIDIQDGHEGWGGLLDEALEEAERTMAERPTPSFRVSQIKEKFGALTIYFRGQDLAPGVRERLSAVTDNARRRSVCICEICGSPACLGAGVGAISVRCSRCAPDGWGPLDIREWFNDAAS
jgi:hypothetical protein